ncbi:MAG: hypothetical protein EP332_03050 [Bacteroidetes bacterium]|nr:MAG: hypothetical protein EP332_03050 [Bacteroidota bacterium]
MKKAGLILFAVSPLLIWSLFYLTTDLWYDEVYSFEHFVIKPWSTTFLDYALPNNHIAHNALLQLISRVFGLRGEFDFAEYVWVFRSFELLLSLATGWLVYKIARIKMPEVPAWLPVFILFSSVLFLNFSLQIRGYMLSTFLLSLTYYLQLLWEVKKKDFLLLAMAFCIAILLYAIPSNAYAVASLGMLWLIQVIKKTRAGGKLELKLGLAIGLGLTLAFLAYLPILDQVLHNDFSEAKPRHPFSVFKFILIWFQSAISSRFILIPAWVIASYVLTKQKRLGKYREWLLLILLPFVFAFLHQSRPFGRVFMPLVPFFALYSALALHVSWRQLKKFHSTFAYLTLLSLYFGLVSEISMLRTATLPALVEHDDVKQDLYRNYYLDAEFQPQRDIERAKESGYPIIATDLIDWPTHNLYLRKAGLDVPRLDSTWYELVLDTSKGPCILLTSVPNRKIRQLKAQDYEGLLLQKHFSMTNSLLVYPQKAENADPSRQTEAPE